MSAELLVNVTPRETRVALIESGVLQEVFVERANRRGLVGNIYKGRVCRVRMRRETSEPFMTRRRCRTRRPTG